ncbi:MAG TPA: response regulator [candidate division Zixibacteria bacterium]|nr:response regulator [candidate division Zixibacteria bacterium]
MTKEDTKIRLLIIDDEADFRRAISQGLSRRGFEVSEAPDGEAGLRTIKANQFDIVILDQMMPGLSGIETLKEIRKSEADLPVIMLTGHGDFNTALAGIRLEIVDFLQKPVEVDQLSERIRGLLSREMTDLMKEPTISELMAPPELYPKVYVDEPLTSVLKAIAEAYRKPIPPDSIYGQVRSALVYDRKEKFLGMIRFSDLLTLLIPDALRHSPYATYFTGMLLAQSKLFGNKTIEGLILEQVFVDVNTPLMEAVHLLVEHRLINIPVVCEGNLAGILRGRDLIIATARLAGAEL